MATKLWISPTPTMLLIGLIWLLNSGYFIPTTEAIWLTVPKTGEKCVYEEIQANTVVVADYICIDHDHIVLGPTLDVRVSSPYGKELYKEKNATNGRFAFTTSESGAYFACFTMHHDQTHHSFNNSVIVSLDWKIGITTTDWDSIAKKDKIQGVELVLRKSKELAGAIGVNMFYLKLREAHMREVNEKTNKRVAQLSFFSLGLSLIVSLLQIWHLKRFFIKKKLI